MPGLVRTRSASVELGEESEQASDQGTENDEDSNGSRSEDDDATSRPRSNPSKRRRISPASEDEDEGSIDDSWALSAPNTARRSTGRSAQNGRRSASRVPNGLSNGVSRSSNAVGTAAQKWKPGQIVRVSLKNFVTYNSITFRPGPSLNMVIGPNGTGKSTLVCAICIGLGWGTQHLGRAKELSEFVKYGLDEYEIIIELKGEEGKINNVIQHNFRKEGAKKTWIINDKIVNQKEVRTLAAKLNIQVDNLCQFLPQDRVVEFSQLSGVDRLTSTQRAAAPQYMTEWYEQLKQLRWTQKKAEEEQSTQRTNLANLEERQNSQRVDVERMRERTDVVQKVNDLKSWTPIVDYYNLRKEHDAAKAQTETSRQEHLELKKQLEPALRVLKDKQAYSRQVDEATESRKTLVDRFAMELDANSKQVTGFSEQLRENETKREALLKSEGSRKAAVQRARTSIDNLTDEKKHAPIAFDSAAYNENIRTAARHGNGIRQDIEDLRNEQQDRSGQLEQTKKNVSNAEREISNLQSLVGQQEAKLERASQDVAKACDWIKSNKSAFTGEVYGPPIVECSIKDMRYASAIESLLQQSDMLMITCTKKVDFDLLDRQLTNTMGLTKITLRQAVHGMEHPNNQSPISREDMQRLGFEGMAIEFLAGPDPVLSVLCESQRLHRTGVTLHESNDQQYERISNSAIANWVTKQNRYSIIRRQEYGDAGVSTQVRDVRPAKFWTGQNVDTAAEGSINSNVARWQSEMEVHAQKLDQMRTRVNELQERLREAEHEKQRLEEERDEKQRALSHYQSLDMKIERYQREIYTLQDRERDIQAELIAIRSEREGLLFSRCEACIKHAITLDTVRRQKEQYLIAQVARTEAASDVEALRTQHEDAAKMLETKRREVDELEKTLQSIRADAKRGRANMQKLHQEDPDLVARYSDRPQEEQNKSREEHQAEIESQTARLELLHEGNPRTITDFEERARKIEALTEKLATQQLELAVSTNEIKQLRTKWEPELDALVAQISTAFAASFEKIGCAGEVSIYKAGPGSSPHSAMTSEANADPDAAEPVAQDNDFDQWAIHISVKFREGETLSLLDSHRQSGGERAVSTIFYLMALQQLSRAPFRVVDEINQGMDPRNERIVHERLVDLACGVQTDGREEQLVSDDDAAGGSSQYFLITPKLLDGLKYVPGMKVLNIVSGEWLPENKTGAEMDFEKLVGLRRQILAAREGGGASPSPLVARVGA
ncbi:MAG: Structural maintenance of chromosomes protein 5 [Chrysothrix sp. TS-e1954]|nr:MAG: Structural maintenance of chromosomes protein 5 [Chrysothrix sp. TS-e1954]